MDFISYISSLPIINNSRPSTEPEAGGWLQAKGLASLYPLCDGEAGAPGKVLKPTVPLAPHSTPLETTVTVGSQGLSIHTVGPQEMHAKPGMVGHACNISIQESESEV